MDDVLHMQWLYCSVLRVLHRDIEKRLDTKSCDRLWWREKEEEPESLCRGWKQPNFGSKCKGDYRKHWCTHTFDDLIVPTRQADDDVFYVCLGFIDCSSARREPMKESDGSWFISFRGPAWLWAVRIFSKISKPKQSRRRCFCWFDTYRYWLWWQLNWPCRKIEITIRSISRHYDSACLHQPW